MGKMEKNVETIIECLGFGDIISIMESEMEKNMQREREAEVIKAFVGTWVFQNCSIWGLYWAPLCMETA